MAAVVGAAVGAVVAHVAAGDEGDVGEAAGVGQGDCNALVIGLLEGFDRNGWAEGGNGNAVDALGDVGVDQLGLFGLVIAGVANDDLLDAEFGAGILEALDHGFHELVVLEDYTGYNDVLGSQRCLGSYWGRLVLACGRGSLGDTCRLRGRSRRGRLCGRGRASPKQHAEQYQDADDRKQLLCIHSPFLQIKLS